MAFYTSLTFYRPRQPPVVRASDLADFITRLRETGLLTNQGFESLQVRFGAAIDQDETGTMREEKVAPGIVVARETKWDIELLQPDGTREILATFAGDRRQVYRAHIALGMPVDSVLRPITRTGSRENTVDFLPDSLSLKIGPIETYALGREERALVGWIGVSISGYGYLFPWTFRDVLQRLEGSPEIQRIVDVCRSFWPVATAPCESRIVAARKQLGALWPYKDFDKPWDWYWGLQEG